MRGNEKRWRTEPRHAGQIFFLNAPRAIFKSTMKQVSLTNRMIELRYNKAGYTAQDAPRVHSYPRDGRTDLRTDTTYSL